MRRARIHLYGTLLTALALQAGAAAGEYGLLSGRLDPPGGTASVLLYDADAGPAPDEQRYLRVPETTQPLGADGSFSIQLAEGSYYIGVLTTNGDIGGGPPRQGDQVCVAMDDRGEPLLVRMIDGEKRTVEPPLLSCQTYSPPNPQALMTMANDPARLGSGATWHSLTGIGGRIEDTAEQPMAGVRVFAQQLNDKIPGGRYISEPSNADGHYAVTVPSTGTYQIQISGPSFSAIRMVVLNDDRWQPVSMLPVVLEEETIRQDFDIVVEQNR